MRGGRGDRDSTGQRRAAPQWPRRLGDRDSEWRVKQTCLQTCPVALHPPGFAANSGPGPRGGVPSTHVQAVGAPDECPLCRSLVSALQNYKGGRARSLVSPITITTAAAVNSVTADALLSACCVPRPSASHPCATLGGGSTRHGQGMPRTLERRAHIRAQARTLLVHGQDCSCCTPPRPGGQVTLAGLGRLCGHHFSSPALTQAPHRLAFQGDFGLLPHPVEDLVEFLLGHLAFLCQLERLHGGASIPQHLQDPLLKVWEKERGAERELSLPRIEPGREAQGQGRWPRVKDPGQREGQRPEQTFTNNTTVRGGTHPLVRTDLGQTAR